MFVNISFIFSLLCEAAVLDELLISKEFELQSEVELELQPGVGLGVESKLELKLHLGFELLSTVLVFKFFEFEQIGVSKLLRLFPTVLLDFSFA